MKIYEVLWEKVKNSRWPIVPKTIHKVDPKKFLFEKNKLRYSSKPGQSEPVPKYKFFIGNKEELKLY